MKASVRFSNHSHICQLRADVGHLGACGSGLVFLLLWMLTAAAAAQQPDLRVRILSAHRVSTVTVSPAPAAAMRLCPGCPPAALASPMPLRAEGTKVMVAGSAHAIVILTGRMKIEPGIAKFPRSSPVDAFATGEGQSRTLSTPIEVSARDGELRFITRMGVEEYTAAAVQGETAGDMPPEALKAMAVTARSYATRFRGRHRRQGFELCDSTHCQNLRPEASAAVRSAVEATRGQLLWDRGQPAAAYHHKDCGGRTESAESVWPGNAAGAAAAVRANYLVSHEDPYCVRASHQWKAEITRDDLQRALVAAGVRLPPAWKNISVVRSTPSGRVAFVRFAAGASDAGALVSASSLRFAVGRALGWGLLKSDWYEIERSGARFVFSGRGFGHGVGLCQTGAGEMARAGKSYQEILAFYFPGTTLGVSAQGIEWEKFSDRTLDVLAARDPSANSNLTALGKQVLRAAGAALASARANTGLSQRSRFEIRVYPTVAMFRDATGEPGWVAASTRDSAIHLQPPAVLQRYGGIETVLRHEFTHLLIEPVAAPGIPLWFREGLAVYLSGAGRRAVCDGRSAAELEARIRGRGSRRAMQSAYASAGGMVELLIRRYGKAEVLGWLSSGLPAAVTRDFPFCDGKMAEHAGGH